MEKTSSPKQRYHLLMIILFGGFLYLMGLIVTNTEAINQPIGSVGFLSNTQYFLTSLGAYALLIGAYIISFRRWHVYPKVPFIIFGVIFLVCAIVPIVGQIMAGAGYTGFDILRHLSYAFLMVGGIIFALSCFPKLTNGTFVYSLVMIGIILCAIYGCVYSYIAETDLYVSVFEGTFDKSGYVVPKSFTGNRNVFAWLLLMGQIALSYLQTRKSHFLNWVLMVFFYLNQFFIVSKTGIILSTCLIIVFFVYRFILSLKKNTIMTLVGLAGGLILLIVTFVLLELTIGKYINHYLEYLVFTFQKVLDGSSNSFMARIRSFEEASALISVSPLTQWFGYGYYAWQEVLFGAHEGAHQAMDITWGMNLLENGLIGFGLSIIVWLYVLITVIRAMKEGMKEGFLILLVYFMFLGRSVVEAADFINMSLFGCILYVTIYFPCASYLAKRKEELAKEVDAPKFVEEPRQNPSFSIGKVYAYLTPAYAILLAFSEEIMGNVPNGSLTYLWINIAISYFFAPLLISSAFYGLKKGKELSSIICLVLSIFYLVTSLVMPIFMKSAEAIWVPLIFLGLGLIFFLYLAKKEMFKGYFLSLVRYLLELAIVGGGFLALLHFHAQVQNTYCLVFVAIDIAIIHLVIDTCLFSSYWSSLSRIELGWEKFTWHLELVEITGFTTKKEKRLEKYSLVNIYNIY